MMRWVIFSVAVVVVTAVATVASSYLGPAAADPKPVLTGKDKPAGPPGSAVVDGPMFYDFGVMAQRRTDGKHEWTVTNKGPGEVRLQKGDTTCSCTIANLPEGKTATLAPGQSTTVTLGWETKDNNNLGDQKYRQTATILVSNDPEHQKLDFTIEGVVRPPVVTFPAEPTIQYLKVNNESPHPREVAIVSYDRPSMKIEGVTTSNPALIGAEVKPLSSEELKQLKADGGHKLVVTIKPGAPLGMFGEDVVLTTDHPMKSKLVFRVVGKLEGPITLSPGGVRMLDVAAKVGHTQVLTLWVRGQKSTKFTVEKKPKGVDVEIAPMGGPGVATASRYQVTVKVPAGLPSGSMISDDIILKTDHPQAGEVKIPISVAVRAS